MRSLYIEYEDYNYRFYLLNACEADSQSESGTIELLFKSDTIEYAALEIISTILSNKISNIIVNRYICTQHVYEYINIELIARAMRVKLSTTTTTIKKEI